VNKVLAACDLAYFLFLFWLQDCQPLANQLFIPQLIWMRAHTISTCTEDCYDKMEPAVSVRLCCGQDVIDDTEHVIDCIKNCSNCLKDTYVTLFHALFSRGRNGDTIDQNKVMED
jgi:hypothetical protein